MEKWYVTGALFIPRLIGSLVSSLAMDDNGLSLKKVLALMSTLQGMKVTNTHCVKENAMGFLIIWLLWSGILVGIYSLNDISKALNSYKKK